jgi:hypothetical protein
MVKVLKPRAEDILAANLNFFYVTIWILEFLNM